MYLRLIKVTCDWTFLLSASTRALPTPAPNIPIQNITVDEARNAALMVQRCLKQVKEMELALRDSNLSKVENILHSGDFKYFEQAANMLLQSEVIGLSDKVELQGIKKYVFTTLRRMKEIVRNRHSIPKTRLLSWNTDDGEESIVKYSDNSL